MSMTTSAPGGARWPRATRSRAVPGVVLAAQILMGLSIAANTFLLVFGVVALAVLASPASAAGPSAAVAGVFEVGLTLVYVVVMFRAQRGLGDGRRSARLVATVFPPVDWIAGLLLASLGGTALDAASWLLVGLPWSALITSLLWLPLPARRWFGDPVDVAGAPLRTDPATEPGPRPADDGDWWAAEARRAATAGNVPRTKRSARPRPVGQPSTGHRGRPGPRLVDLPSGAPAFPTGPVAPVVGQEDR